MPGTLDHRRPAAPATARDISALQDLRDEHPGYGYANDDPYRNDLFRTDPWR